MIRELCSKWKLHEIKASSLVQGLHSLWSHSGEGTQTGTTIATTTKPDDQFVQMIEKSLQDMEGAYYFMLMTINRSTHYTKTLHHVALIPSMESFDVDILIYKVINIVASFQFDAKIQYRNDLSVSSNRNKSFVNSDKQWMLDNLLCLISNAVKYSRVPQGGCEAIVRRLNSTTFPFFGMSHLTYYHSDHNICVKEWMTFEIYDKGPGLQEDEAQALFEAPDFSEQRSMGGAGLGLYCLGKRIQILNGCYGIRKRTDDEVGLIFWFAIPIDQEFDTPSGKRTSTFRSSKDLQIIRDEDINHAVHELLPIKRLDSNEEQKGSPFQAAQSQANALLAEERPVSSVSESKVPRYQATLRNGNHLKILLVDDALPVLKMLRMMLENNGHQVTGACNGKEAVDILYPPTDTEAQSATERFDAILMDLQMPIMDGFEAMRYIRSKENEGQDQLEESVLLNSSSQESSTTEEQYVEKRTRKDTITASYVSLHPPVIIIAMSANSDHVSMQRAYAVGADNFIGKPFKMEKFNDALQACREARYSDYYIR